VNEIEPVRNNNCFTQCNRVCKVSLGQLIKKNKCPDQNYPKHTRALSPVEKKHEEKSRNPLIKSALNADAIDRARFLEAFKAYV
jgi:hypothetical protein